MEAFCAFCIMAFVVVIGILFGSLAIGFIVMVFESMFGWL